METIQWPERLMKGFHCLFGRFLERLTVLHQNNFLPKVSCTTVWTAAGNGKHLRHNSHFFFLHFNLFVSKTTHFCNVLSWRSFFYWFNVRLHLGFWQCSCEYHKAVHRSFKVTWPDVELCGNIDYCISKSPKGGTVWMRVCVRARPHVWSWLGHVY